MAGCGGSDDGDDQDGPTADSSSSDDPGAEPTDYLPVPEGVTLTEAGAELGLGDQATVAWRPRQDTVVALDLIVERIDRTTFEESFDGWVVTPEMKGQVPYFVLATATNVGADAVGDLLVPLYGATAGRMYEPLDFREELFEPCPGGSLPEELRPGRSTELCFVYLLPKEQQLEAAAFDVGGELSPVRWSGRITAIEKPDNDRKKDGKQNGEGAQRDEQTG
jgi:hypothetical protein